MSSRYGRFAAAVAFGGLSLLFVAGAWKTDPSADPSALDLSILQDWGRRGFTAPPPTLPGHLVKPGYLLLLRVLVPHGLSPDVLRRIALANAVWIAGCCLAVCTIVWRSGRPRSAVGVATLTAVALPFRDAADYLASEPIALGFAFLTCALLIRERRIAAVAALGAALAAFAAIRPNTSYLLAILALIVVVSRPRSGTRASALGAGFLLMFCLLALAGPVFGTNLNPLSMTSSQAALFGTAHYSWPGDLPAPSTKAPVSSREHPTTDRWQSFLKETPRDRNRFLAWRTTHAVLSAEQFPGRWQSLFYSRADLMLRQWWWVVGIFWSCAAVACAVGGRGPWRFVPFATLVMCVVQGLVFGAEQRYALPLLPMALVGLVMTVPSVSFSRVVALGSMAPILAAVWALREAPDAASSDFAVIRGGERIIRQAVASPLVAGGQGATLHIRLLFPSDSPLGFEIFVNDRFALRKEPGQNSSSPAYVSIRLDPDAAKRIQSRCAISVRTIAPPGPSGSAHSFVYFPVVPPILGSAAILGDDPRFETISGAPIRGGIPAWIHSGFD